VSKKIRGEKRKKILEMIRNSQTISLQDIKKSTNINYNTIRSTVASLIKAGLIERVERGVYRAK
jgi:DeoR/GlpR family transcriptional regulator of sugar metabolism